MEKLITAHDLTFEPMIHRQVIADRVLELGLQIKKDYEGKRPLFLCVLNGAFIFAADLVRACDLECEIAFVRLSSYEGTASSGSVTTTLGINAPLEGRHLIVLEDIVDSGRTLHYFLEQLREEKPASVALAALLSKPEALQFDVHIDYVGFEIPEKFVIGYGLDYDGLCRNLADIYQLSR